MPSQEKPTPGRRTATVLLCCAAALIPWIVYLAVTMGAGEYTVRRWGVAWVGLDVAEVLGLVAVALLARRRDVRTSPVAAVTGTLFLVDVWFDTVTSHQGMDYVESLSFAWLTAGPLGVFLSVTAWRSLGWAAPQGAPQDDAVRSAAPRAAAPQAAAGAGGPDGDQPRR
ncbi:hypothetical protein [Kitasatospora sp. NPDC018619]|uniref:hypothetical protein n=1 Tax=unclassified Kitasatospora TaxID=2633591 RepID=UPI0037B4B03B